MSLIFSKKTITNLFLVVLSFTAATIFPQKVDAQGTYSLKTEYQVSNKFLVVGDRVDVSLKAYLKDDKPMTQDRKARFTIRNPKNGQKCETTDDTFKDDGVIKGWCEAKIEAGNMEIAVSTDDQSSFSVDGTTYSPYVYQTYNAMFNDPNQTCKDANQAPSSVVLTKQNDVTMDIKWQHVENFVGYYEVMYGNIPGEYSWIKKTEQKSVVIDSLDANKEYYFKVRAVSACKTTTYSGVFKYVPRTGSVSAASEKPAGSPSPSPAASKAPTATPTPKASPKTQTTPVPSTQPTVTPTAEPKQEEVKTPSSPVPTAEPKSPTSKKGIPFEIVLIAGGVLVPLIGVGTVSYLMFRKRKAQTL